MPLLPIFDSPPSLCLPDLGFRVLHHENFTAPHHTSAPINIYTTIVGTYSSLAAAQTAALHALEASLRAYEKSGYSGNVYKEIDLQMQGLITEMDGKGQERPMSEFRIEAVESWSPGIVPPDGGEEEVSLFTDSEREATPTTNTKKDKAKQKVVVKLPPHTDRAPLPQYPFPRAPPDFELEKDDHWTQTRVPYFRKRPDEPFRSADDPPYRENMGYVRRFLKAHELPTPTIVVEQPDGFAIDIDIEEQKAEDECDDRRDSKIEDEEVGTRSPMRRSLWRRTASAHGHDRLVEPNGGVYAQSKRFNDESSSPEQGKKRLTLTRQ